MREACNRPLSFTFTFIKRKGVKYQKNIIVMRSVKELDHELKYIALENTYHALPGKPAAGQSDRLYFLWHPVLEQYILASAQPTEEIISFLMTVVTFINHTLTHLLYQNQCFASP